MVSKCKPQLYLGSTKGRATYSNTGGKLDRYIGLGERCSSYVQNHVIVHPNQDTFDSERGYFSSLKIKVSPQSRSAAASQVSFLVKHSLI